jgi:hypothetical protein
VISVITALMEGARRWMPAAVVRCLMDPRVQERTHFADTNEAFLCSVRLVEGEQEPEGLVLMLHGRGATCSCRGNRLELAEQNGYIWLRPWGSTSGAGMARRYGFAGRRWRAATGGDQPTCASSARRMR